MTSFKFLAFIFIFIPIVLLIYHLSPKQLRWIVLLVSSIAFYIVSSGKLIVYLAVTTLSVYYCGILLDKQNLKMKQMCEGLGRDEKKPVKEKFKKRKNLITAAALLVCFGIIAVLKYSAFFNSSLNELFKNIPGLSLPVRRYALPLGISFYTMMAASYIIDVNRGVVDADHHLGRLSLYLCFFPQIMEGPMCRYGETASQLFEGKDLEYKNIFYGALRILFGMIKRMLVADRVNNFVGSCFTDYGLNLFDGGALVIGTLCYTFQLYMDFSGTMDIVIGSAELFGIILPENFRFPFLSKTISEFWTRWHITLGRWFTDYIFYPISMSKPMKKLTSSSRKNLGKHFGPLLTGAVALICVWLCNGLWHGAGWTFVFFGMFHFVLILNGNLVEPLLLKFYSATKIDRNCIVIKILRILRTFLLVNLGEMFFRCDTVKRGFTMLKKMVTDLRFTSLITGKLFNYGLEKADYILLIVFAVFLVVYSLIREKGVDIRDRIYKMSTFKKALVFVAMLMILVVFGGYGSGYTYVEPIYAKF